MEKFQSILTDFLQFASLESDTYRTFTRGYLRLRKDRDDDKTVEHAQNLDRDPYEESFAIFNENCDPEGEFLANPSILGYLVDAIELYQRCPDKRGDIGLLFAPTCPHIKALKHAISLLEDKSLTFVGDEAGADKAKVSKVASRLGEMLDELWANTTIDVKQRAKNNQLSVHGYSATIFFGESSKYGLGFVEHIHKQGSKTFSTITFGSDALLPHLMEYNALLDLQWEVDASAMHIVRRDGQVMGFNRDGLPDVPRYILTASPDQHVQQYVRDVRNWHRENPKIEMKVTEADIDFVENTLLPYVCDKYPAPAFPTQLRERK